MECGTTGGGFIDRPVKEYSSGMYVRLAFATAIHVDPEILIVDEALAVGDAIFANRCIKRFEILREKGVTVLFVSHDLGLVKRLSDRAMLMLDGRVAAEGNPSEVVNRYVGVVLERQEKAGQEQRDRQGEKNERLPGTLNRHGDGASRVIDVDLRDAKGSTRRIDPGAPVTVCVRARAERDIEDPVVGVLIRNRLGIDVFGTNTRVEGVQMGSVEAGEIFEVEFHFDCLLTRQEYTLTVATQYPEGFSQDWLDDVISFSVIDSMSTSARVSSTTFIACLSEMERNLRGRIRERTARVFTPR